MRDRQLIFILSKGTIIGGDIWNGLADLMKGGIDSVSIIIRERGKEFDKEWYY